MYNKIIVQPLRNNCFKILKEITYKDTIIPIGYKTNGANVPRIFWSFYPPNKTDYLPAVIVHDYLCDKEQYKKADEYFHEILKELNVNKFTIFIFTTSVKLYHKIRYNT